VPDTRPDLTGHPVALFVFSNLREQKGGLTRAWLRRLSVFHEAGWDTHIATIHRQPEIDDTLAAWRERGWLPAATTVHHYQRRDKRFRPSWSRRTDESFTRDDRVADWLDWLVGRLPGVVVFADSPVTYAPVAMMRNPHVGRIMTVHLAHRKGGASAGQSGAGAIRSRRASQIRSRYAGPVGQPRLSGRLLPFAGAADAVVALTHKQAADLIEDLPGLEVHVIPNMIDPVPSDLVPVRDPLRVVQLGRLDAVKRVDHAIRAVGIAARAFPGIRLEVYGRGPELEHLLELRSELGLEDVVSFPGFTEEPLEVLAGSAASLMTSRREGFGLAVAESLAAGTPVVTYDVDYGPAELVSDGVNGRVVADGSVEDLAAALVQVLADPEAWSRMSQAAPAAAERLRPDVVSAQWLDLAVDVAARVEVPSRAFLVEDLRVRRAGLDVEGVVIGAVTLPGRVRILGGAEVPLEAPEDLSTGASRSDRATGLVARDVRATLPWSAVALWPDAAALAASTGEGVSIPVRGPGLPVTVAPTEARTVLVGWDEEQGVVRRVTGPDPVAVTGRLTSVRADVGEDVTVLSEIPIARARVSSSRATSTDLEVHLLPGLALTAESELAVAAGAGDHAVRVGRFRLAGGEADPAKPRDTVLGVIEWDAQGLAELLSAGTAPALVWLSVGISLRLVAPVELDAGRVLALDAGDRWVLAPAASGRAMLVPGRGLRIRLAQAARRLRRKRVEV
jgi:glycosyltransferase involved in cell wall biosynthesis